MKLENLIDQVMEILSKRGYTEKTWKFAFRNGRFSSLRHFYEMHGTEEFDTKLANEYIFEIQRTYETGRLSYYRAAHLKKIAKWFIEVYETGELHWKQPRRRKICLYPCFESEFFKYIDSIRNILSFKNVEGQRSVVLDFLEFLQNEKDYNDFSVLSLKDIQGFVLFKRQRVKGVILFRFLFNFICQILSLWLVVGIIYYSA